VLFGGDVNVSILGSSSAVELNIKQYREQRAILGDYKDVYMPR
jgi:hypothetical protein